MSIINMNAHKTPGLVQLSYSHLTVEEAEERLFAQIHRASSGKAKINIVCSHGPCRCVLLRAVSFSLFSLL